MHLNVPRDMKLTRGIKNVILKAGKASWVSRSTDISLIQQFCLVTMHTNKQI